jgi:hypothetical protein
MVDVNETLASRQTTYGDFADVAHRAQTIKLAMRSSKNWNALSSCHREALEMIANKIARMLEGNSNYIDTVHDISGYAELIVRYLERENYE